jgi:hypothetical protein
MLFRWLCEKRKLILLLNERRTIGSERCGTVVPALNGGLIKNSDPKLSAPFNTRLLLFEYYLIVYFRLFLTDCLNQNNKIQQILLFSYFKKIMMSYQLLKQDVLFYQRFLKSAGYYDGELDGQWGPLTNTADADFLVQSKSIYTQDGTFDSASESNITTLIPKAQIEARKFLKIATNHNLDIRILSGTRTYDEQNCLYGHGRNGNKEPIITTCTRRAKQPQFRYCLGYRGL